MHGMYEDEYIGDQVRGRAPGEYLREISWQAPEHHHTEKGSDWYWALGIITISGAITMIVFGNVLFGVVILLAGFGVALLSSRPPRLMTYSISPRGVRIGNDLHPYSTLRCFFLNEEYPHHVQLLLDSHHTFTPLLIIPVPDELIEDVEHLLEVRLPEEHLEEPLGQRILEFLGF